MTTGLTAATDSAARTKSSPEAMLSKYPTTTVVSSSLAKADKKSVSSRSALLPMETRVASPSLRAAAQSKIAVQSAPDWEKTEMPPD